MSPPRLPLRLSHQCQLPRRPPLAAAPVAAEVAAGGVIPLEGVRRVIAERMRQSLQESAQVTLVAEADARRFHELRTELAGRHEPTLGFRIS